MISYSLSYSQNKTSIERIKKQYQETNKNLNSYKHNSIERFGISTEGAEVTFYYTQDSLKLIKENIYGEMGKSEILYYMNDTAVYFILENQFMYNRPLLDSLRNNKLTTNTARRYYFENDKLIKSINYDKVFGIEKIIKELKELIILFNQK